MTEMDITVTDIAAMRVEIDKRLWADALITYEMGQADERLPEGLYADDKDGEDA